MDLERLRLTLSLCWWPPRPLPLRMPGKPLRWTAGPPQRHPACPRQALLQRSVQRHAGHQQPRQQSLLPRQAAWGQQGWHWRGAADSQQATALPRANAVLWSGCYPAQRNLCLAIAFSIAWPSWPEAGRQSCSQSTVCDCTGHKSLSHTRHGARHSISGPLAWTSFRRRTAAASSLSTSASFCLQASSCWCTSGSMTAIVRVDVSRSWV